MWGARGHLAIHQIDFVMSTIPCLLPARQGSSFVVEPYLPHRFARQFGFDQGLPEAPPELPRSSREAGVGTYYWYTLCSRFEKLVNDSPVFLPGTMRPLHTTYNYVGWYACKVMRIHQRLSPGVVFFGHRPLDPTVADPKDQREFERILRRDNPDIQARAPRKEFWMDVGRNTLLMRSDISIPSPRWSQLYWTSSTPTVPIQEPITKDSEATTSSQEPSTTSKYLLFHFRGL